MTTATTACTCFNMAPDPECGVHPPGTPEGAALTCDGCDGRVSSADDLLIGTDYGDICGDCQANILDELHTLALARYPVARLGRDY